MTWVYQQSTGILTAPDGVEEGRGYSGNGAGVNNAAAQNVVGVGPIPQGEWTIGPAKNPPDHLGPIAMPLTPKAGTDTFGRSAFFMHGDNGANDESASHGCIVMGRAIRRAVDNSSDSDLTVVA